MANIRDVAKAAGVSIATVSRILKGIEPSSKDKKDAVLNAVKTLNYSIPSAYRRKRSIACVINITAEKHDDSYYLTILDGIKNELSKHYYSVDYVSTKYDLDEVSELRRILKHRIEGFIIMTELENRALSLIKEKTKNIVCVDTNTIEFDNIRYNRFEAGCRAMQYLIENGHRKIAFVGSHLKQNISLQFGRFDAYRLMMKKYEYKINPDWIIDCKWERQNCFEMTKKLLKSKDKPSAIFSASDYMATASMSAINEMGLSVPEDISVIGISDIDEAKYLNPPLTTVQVPKYEIGQITARTLIDRIKGDSTAQKQIYVPTSLIVRKSVRAIQS